MRSLGMLQQFIFDFLSLLFKQKIYIKETIANKLRMCVKAV